MRRRVEECRRRWKLEIALRCRGLRFTLPLAPVLRGEGSGVRGLRHFPRAPHPNPSPRSTGARGEPNRGEVMRKARLTDRAASAKRVLHGGRHMSDTARTLQAARAFAPRPVNGDRPFISVIVPVRNEARFIAGTLSQLLTQDYDPRQFEVLVADGGSTDATCDIVVALRRRFANLRLLGNAGGWSSAGRTLQWKRPGRYPPSGGRALRPRQSAIPGRSGRRL